MSLKRSERLSDVGGVPLGEVRISLGADQIAVLEVLDAQVVVDEVDVFAYPDLDVGRVFADSQSWTVLYGIGSVLAILWSEGHVVESEVYEGVVPPHQEFAWFVYDGWITVGRSLRVQCVVLV